jgi:hypothetical protein
MGPIHSDNGAPVSLSNICETFAAIAAKAVILK